MNRRLALERRYEAERKDYYETLESGLNALGASGMLLGLGLRLAFFPLWAAVTWADYVSGNTGRDSGSTGRDSGNTGQDDFLSDPRSEVKLGFDDGYAQALNATGSQVPTPTDRSEGYQRGFLMGWQEGLKKNLHLNKDEGNGP
jgi:hypothetical protein